MNISPGIETLVGECPEALRVGDRIGNRIGPEIDRQIAHQDVSRRKVFYVSGFDPIGPRRYRELYRAEGPAQAAVTGCEIQVSALPRTDCGNFRWCATYRRDAARTVSEFEFLGWDDIVRGSIRPKLGAVYALMFRTFWIYLSSGAIAAMLRLRAGPLVAGLVPAAMMIFYLIYSGLIGISVGLLAVQGLGAPGWLGAGVGLGAAALAMLATRLFEEQMMIYFVVNDLAYSAGEGGRYPAPLCARLDRFAARIQDARASGDFDEILVVGHSSGAQLAVSALSRVTALHGLDGGTPVALMTLGQSIAMTSFLPHAHELRADLARLADDPRLFWLDVTAPGDGACFALSDPSATCRAGGRPDDAPNPLVISAAFRHTMEPGELRRYRWRLLRMHFQYLCAFARPSAFDYFEITAGPLALATRFMGRECSPSMSARPVAPVLHPA